MTPEDFPGENVKDALHDLALDAPEGPDDLAAQAWAGGQRLRRRRSRLRIGLAVCATVVVCGAMIVVTAPSERQLPLAPPTPSARVEANDHLPSKRNESSLRQLTTQYPASVDVEPLQARPLSMDPVTRALALFQTAPDDPVLVLGDDGRMRRIEIVFDPIPGGETTLSLDGRTAVVPQRDAVVLVDLTSGSSRQVPAKGANQGAALSADGTQLAVTNDRTTKIIRVSDGQVLHDQGRQAPLVAGPGQAFFGVGEDDDGTSLVREVEAGGTTAAYRMPPVVGELWGLPAVNATRLAAAGNDVVVAFTTHHDGPRRVLGAPASEGRARPLKWLDDTTLLVLRDGAQPLVLGWNTKTGEITRVMHVQRKAVITL